MNEKIASLLRLVSESTYLGVGVIILGIGLIIRFFPLVNLYIELILPSVAGIALLVFGSLLVVVGLIHHLTGKTSLYSANGKGRLFSKRELKHRFAHEGLEYSSESVEVLSKISEASGPINRKQIADASGLSNGHLTRLLKAFVEKGYVLEFQARGRTCYYDLTEKGLRLSEDVKAAINSQQQPKTVFIPHELEDSWLNRRRFSRTRTPNAQSKEKLKRAIIRQQLVLAIGFLGGLFVHFGLAIETGLSAVIVQATHIPVLPLIVTFAWFASSLVCAYKTGRGLGVTTLALAWAAGMTVFRGENMAILGISLLMSAVAIEAFDALYS